MQPDLAQREQAQPLTIVAAFADAFSAHAAMPALYRVGVPAHAVTVAGGSRAPQASVPHHEREAGFLWRLVLIVVFWSMVGAAVGVVMGIALVAAGVPPGGVTGVGIQIAAWSIFAHLIAGMWAGYALLTRGESRQPVTTVRGGRVLVRVHVEDAQGVVVQQVLRAAGALTIGVYGPDGRPVAPTKE